MHKLLGVNKKLADLIAGILEESPESTIVDLCSGSGGPMPEVLRILKDQKGLDINLILTDLYPDLETANIVNSEPRNDITYLTDPVDATNFEREIGGLKTMVGSFHHMAPAHAERILASACKNEEPLCIFEISDNSTPIWLWWIAIPINFIMTFFITPMVRPMSWKQLIFTYIIPVIPICFAWDGAVSNARTYTLSDLDELLKSINSDDYEWEKGTIKGKTKQLYLIGIPG